MWTVNARAVVREMGGPARVRDILKANGCNRTIKAIEKWMERNSIPSGPLAILFATSKIIGRPMDIYRYIRTSKGESVDDIKL